MNRRFVVLTESATAEQEQRFVNFVNNRLGWWKWFPNSWLLVDNREQFTSAQIRDVAAGIFPTAALLVLEFRDDGTHSWHGMQKGDMFQWFDKNWENPG